MKHVRCIGDHENYEKKLRNIKLMNWNFKKHIAIQKLIRKACLTVD